MDIEIRSVTAKDSDDIPALSRLLQDAVHGGASVGFLSPLSDADAEEYWRATFAALSDDFVLWVARAGTEIVGSIQLERCRKPNGRHRAEVLKLFVHRSYRGRGLSSLLMRAAEDRAQSWGCKILILDTEAGSAAELIYKHLGWTRAGEIPDFALNPSGVLRPTVYFYKFIC